MDGLYDPSHLVSHKLGQAWLGHQLDSLGTIKKNISLKAYDSFLTHKQANMMHIGVSHLRSTVPCLPQSKPTQSIYELGQAKLGPDQPNPTQIDIESTQVRLNKW